MKRIIFIASAILFAARMALAGAGTTGAEFMKVNVGGRASAFCGAYTAVSGDVYTSQYNPAGLSSLQHKEIALMHNEWLLDTRYEFFAFGLPLPNGALALGVRYFDMGSFTGRDGLGNRTGNFSASDQAISLSYAQTVSESLSFGMSLIYLEQKIASKESTGIAADLGLDFSVIEDCLTLALVAKNLGPEMSAFEREKMDLPQSNNIGVLFTPGEGDLMLTSDLILPKDENPYIALGCEYDAIQIIDIRAGLSMGSERENAVNWTVGMGLNIFHYSLDYCFEPVGDLDSSHRISLSVKF